MKTVRPMATREAGIYSLNKPAGERNRRPSEGEEKSYMTAQKMFPGHDVKHSTSTDAIREERSFKEHQFEIASSTGNVPEYRRRRGQSSSSVESSGATLRKFSDGGLIHGNTATR